jgi:outer membrane biosynthesis protein TonB
MSESEQEKKNKRIAALTTTGINVLVLLILLLAVAWRAPNPPLPEYGIELNFGMDTEGSGAVQPDQPVGSPETDAEEPQNSEPQETPAESSEESTVDESKPVETERSEEQVVSKVESPVEVKEEKKEESKPIEKPVEKPTEKKSEPKVEEKPKVDANATYNPNKSKSTAETATSKAGQPASHGDDKDKTGDKGSPEGKLDANALYGKSGGGGGGSSLDLAGWEWDSRPSPKIPDNEAGGRVKFQIKVDSNGEIREITTLERSVSPETERICRQAVQRLTFTKTGENVPDISTGTITFIVRSK